MSSDFKVNLHSILRYLVDDPKFLSTYIENKDGDVEKEKEKSAIKDVIKVTEYVILAPGETSNFNKLPKKIRLFLEHNQYTRVGIRPIVHIGDVGNQSDLSHINQHNVSFLASLNLILIPEIAKLEQNEQTKKVLLLEELICHRIERNYQIDKVKNTKKVQEKNKTLINLIRSGNINKQIIDYIVNIFEINLLIFDMNNLRNIEFYWNRGVKHEYLNLFRDVHCMIKIGNNYEPLVLAKPLPEKIRKNIYCRILCLEDKIQTDKISLNVMLLSYLNTWNLPLDIYTEILKRYFKNSTKTTFDLIYDQLIASKVIKPKKKS